MGQREREEGKETKEMGRGEEEQVSTHRETIQVKKKESEGENRHYTEKELPKTKQNQKTKQQQCLNPYPPPPPPPAITYPRTSRLLYTIIRILRKPAQFFKSTMRQSIINVYTYLFSSRNKAKIVPFLFLLFYTAFKRHP